MIVEISPFGRNDRMGRLSSHQNRCDKESGIGKSDDSADDESEIAAAGFGGIPEKRYGRGVGITGDHVELPGFAAIHEDAPNGIIAEMLFEIFDLAVVEEKNGDAPAGLVVLDSFRQLVQAHLGQGGIGFIDDISDGFF